ncbi:Uncharacterized protein At4g15970 [Linum grandiflorum]
MRTAGGEKHPVFGKDFESENVAGERGRGTSSLLRHEIWAGVVLGVVLCCTILYAASHSSSPELLLSFSPVRRSDGLLGRLPTRTNGSTNAVDPELIEVLRKATATVPPESSLIPNKTVILVTITEALARPGSMLDLFLESFWVGNGTQELLRHLVIVSLDRKAHQRCQAVHPHCYEMPSSSTKDLSNLTTDASFMTQEYLVVVWRKIELVASVLQLGYDLILTDADIMWFRNPFTHLAAEPAADIQVACDDYRGNSSNPNTGFLFVRTNNRTIRFLNHWYESRIRYPKQHDQDVFSHIIRTHQFVHQIGLRIRFLDTAYFGGFCQPVKDLSLATTMHANCCVGMETKVHDLKIVLRDWKHFSSAESGQNSTRFDWTPPRVQCGRRR